MMQLTPIQPFKNARIHWCLAVVFVTATYGPGCNGGSPDSDAPSSVESLAASSTGLSLPVGPMPQWPWGGRPCAQIPAEQLLACVDGAAISRADYERVRLDYPDHVTAKQVIQALVNAELLAAQAAKAGLWSDWLILPYKQALAQAWLRHHFEKNYPPEKVADADIKRAFRDDTVRVRYNRQRSFFATDAQILCCRGDWKECDARPEVSECIDRKAEQARGLHQALVADPPASAAEMQARALVLVARFADVGVAEVNFYYDTSKPYEEQKGYDLMVKPYAEAVVRLKEGEISQPIRSPYGWHVSRLDRIVGALDGRPSDPAVRADIAANILPLVRKRDMQKEVFERMKKLGVQMHFDRLTR